jgi:hypothetical protein
MRNLQNRISCNYHLDNSANPQRNFGVIRVFASNVFRRGLEQDTFCTIYKSEMPWPNTEASQDLPLARQGSWVVASATHQEQKNCGNAQGRLVCVFSKQVG